MFRRILVANDGSKGGYNALDMALDIADACQAELHMLTVEEIIEYGSTAEVTMMAQSQTRPFWESVVEKSQGIAALRGVPLETHLLTGFPEPTIIDFAKDFNFDLLVVGFMEHSWFYNWFIGGTTDKLVDHVPCSVLVVK